MAAAEICGDVPLTPCQRLKYLMQNAGRNIKALGRGPKTRAFRPPRLAPGAMVGQSPSRFLTELFIATELPKLTSPGYRDVIEIGCGSGSMAGRLAGLGYNGRYTGVDIVDRFRSDQANNLPFEVNFICADVHDFRPPYNADLMISISVLEHIPADTAAIRRLAEFINTGGVEVHVVPAGWGLAVYLWHGFRQYSPASLVDRFGADIQIVGLGGFGSLLLHTIAITLPELCFKKSLRKTIPRIYSALISAALCVDRLLPVCPTAYAVIRRHKPMCG